MTPENGPLSFGTFEKRAPGRHFDLVGKLPWQHYTCEIGHFRVHVCLLFKTSLSAKSFYEN